MASKLTAFNTQIENLLNALIVILPDHTEIQLYKEKFELARKANPRKIMSVFIQYVYPHKEQIMSKTESFFLDEENLDDIIAKDESDVVMFKKSDRDFILTKALNLKTLWTTTLTQQHKDTIWTYFQVLIKLCEQDALRGFKR